MQLLPAHAAARDVKAVGVGPEFGRRSGCNRVRAYPRPQGAASVIGGTSRTPTARPNWGAGPPCRSAPTSRSRLAPAISSYPNLRPKSTPPRPIATETPGLSPTGDRSGRLPLRGTAGPEEKTRRGGLLALTPKECHSGPLSRSAAVAGMPAAVAPSTP